MVTPFGLGAASKRPALLSREREVELGRRIRDADDQAAIDELVTAHIRLVLGMAAKFRTSPFDPDDIASEGIAGLMIAARKFDPELGVRFATFASYWVKAEIQNYVFRNWSVVRGSTSGKMRDLFLRYPSLEIQARSALGTHEPGPVNRWIAEKAGATVEQVEAVALRRKTIPASFDTPATKDGITIAEVLEDDAPGPHTLAEAAIDDPRRTEALKAALGLLSDRERQILAERYTEGRGTTLEALGAVLGVSKERVRQVEERAIQKLRRALVTHHKALFPEATT